MIYFDNNATTMMPQEIIDIMVKWFNKGNPSAAYKSAKLCKAMIREFKLYLANWGGFSLYEGQGGADGGQYEIIFTSCASEANNMIIRASVDAYWAKLGTMPHVITSAIEHKSALLCLEGLAKLGRCEYSLAPTGLTGHILADDVAQLVRDNTCLISIMVANNETGAINDIKSLATMAHSYSIPFYSDVVQYFGKYKLNAAANGLDAFGLSFHKVHGPPGVGALAIKRAFIDGYGLEAQICGTQNNGLRGGTENVPGLAGSYAAMKFIGENRALKNKQIYSIKAQIMTNLADKWPTISYLDYINGIRPASLFIVFISGLGPDYLCGTLLLSVVKLQGPPMCNVKLKEALEANGAIVSIGSACNTASDKASHVLDQLGADQYIRKGTIRISIGDLNRPSEAKKFVEAFNASLSAILIPYNH
jgi:cysteine desulfurase